MRRRALAWQCRVRKPPVSSWVGRQPCPVTNFPSDPTHQAVPLRVLYFGTPVVVVSSVNPDGTTNIAPMSSAWWLGQDAMLGMANSSQTVANLRRDAHCVLNLMTPDLAAAVDRLALLTGHSDPPAGKLAMGYRYEADKFRACGFTAQRAELVRADRVRESPIQIEGQVVALHAFESSDGTRASAIQVRALRTHVVDDLLVPGTDYVDPNRWDPLLMKFCEFFGGASVVRLSRLGRAWGVPAGRSSVR